MSGVLSAPDQRHFSHEQYRSPSRFAGVADGSGLARQAGGLLLARTAVMTGLGQALSDGLARWRAPRALHDPGKIVLDLAVAVALGGDCLADAAAVRAQTALFGPVASDPRL